MLLLLIFIQFHLFYSILLQVFHFLLLALVPINVYRCVQILDFDSNKNPELKSYAKCERIMKALLTISVLVMHRDNVDICLDSGYNNYYIK